MTTKIRTTLLTGLFIFVLLTGLQAQDKYEYAIIQYTPFNKQIQISINGVDFKKIDVPKDKIKGYADANAGLEELNKMTEQGWELFNTGHSTGSGDAIQIFLFYLKKKK